MIYCFFGYYYLYKQEEGKWSIIVHGISFLCLWVCVASWHVYSAVDLGLMLSGFGPQLGDATGAELLWARPLRPPPLPRPLCHRLHAHAQCRTGSFCPWIVVFSSLSSLAVLAVRTFCLLPQTPARFLRCFIVVCVCVRPCKLALEFQLSSHLGTAVLKPNLETNEYK